MRMAVVYQGMCFTTCKNMGIVSRLMAYMHHWGCHGKV